MTLNSLSDRYEVVRLLGSGTSGQVFLGRDRGTGDAVAIKQFKKTVGSRPALQEASVILGINHPQVVRCLDFFYLGPGDLYLVYEFVEGGTLRGILETRSGLPVGEALECTRQLLRGLQHLHGLGLIHCDLKPENVFVRQPPLTGKGSKDGPRYKLGDLGVAQFHHSVNKATAGTPAYMAPERFIDTFSFNADLYSIGIMLFEMLVGDRPFHGSPNELARAHLRQRPELSKIADPRLRDFLDSLLDKDPRHRVQRADAALATLNSLSDQAPKAVPMLRGLTPNRSALGSVPPFRREGLRRLGSFELPHRFERLHALHRAHHPVLVVEGGGHLEFLDADLGERLNLVVPNVSQVVHTAGPHALVYATRARICRFDLLTQQEETLVEDCQRVAGLFLPVEQDLLLWADNRQAYRHDLAKGRVQTYACANFGLTPQLRTRSDGAVLFTTGPIRPTLHVASPEGPTMLQIPLAGPALEMTTGREVFLVVSLNHDDGERMVLHRIDLQGTVERALLPPGVEMVSATRDCVVLLFHDGRIQTWTLDLEIHEMQGFDSQTRVVAVTSDNRFLLTLGGQTVASYENTAALR